MTLSRQQVEEIARGTEGVTPGPWYTCGPPWFQTGSGVMAGSPDPHVGYVIADTEVWDGERDEYRENEGPVRNLADPDTDARHIARCDPDTIRALCALALQALDAGQPVAVTASGSKSVEVLYARGAPSSVEALRIVRAHVQKYGELIDRGKGEHGQPGYVRDDTWNSWIGALSMAREIERNLEAALFPPQERVEAEDPIDGTMWSAGRAEFQKYAERYRVAQRHEEAETIADIAPAEIFGAMRKAEMLLAIDSLAKKEGA